ncbi:MAG: type II toxin-antitoxin system Phd/YefM family antitoxin [Pseudomonadota bacterium]
MIPESECISKSEFKARALEVLREIEQSGKPKIITDRGKPTLEIRKLRDSQVSPLEKLKGTVIKYEAATAPIADDDWENA